MPAVTVKNLPDGLYQRLKTNAQAHHRSINGELIATLERALCVQQTDPEQQLAQQLAQIRALRSGLDLPLLDPDEIRAAIESGRP
jgi:plasmid stability protein